MKKGLLLVLIMFLGCTQLLFAQTKKITGTVSSLEDNQPIPGVSILVKGTSVGIVTNMDGKFELTVPESSKTLVFSFIGMKTVEKQITGNVVDVVMEQDYIGVDEVVVVGYGTTTKQSFVGSIKSVKNENIQSKSVSSVSQSLAGEIAGVRVINTSGQPGTNATVRIRGFGSVNGNRDPLYVVDGIPYSGDLNTINPNDIESSTVLKDATATAIYGSRGANGVILLTTKSGKSGSSVIEVDLKTGVNVSGLPRYSLIKSPEQYIGLSWEAMYNKGVATGNVNPTAYANTNLFSASGITPSYNLWNTANVADLIDPVTRTVKDGVTRKYDPENWEDYGFQNSSRTEANITFRGGSETTKYFTSFGYLNDVGYIIGSNFKRYNATINLESMVKPWLSTSMKMSYAGTEQKTNGQSEDSGSIFWFVDNLPPIFPLFLRDATGAIVTDPIFGGNQYDYGVGRAFGALTNSIADAYFNSDTNKNHQVSGNIGTTIRFTKNLTFENTFGAQYYSRKRNDLGSPYYGGSAGQGGSVYKTTTQVISYNVLSLLRYKKTFGVHNLEALVAHEANSFERKFESQFKSKMVDPNIDDLNNFVVSSPSSSYTEQARLESYFGQINYNFENKYYLSTSLRRDGSSRFIGDNKWDTFGSLGLSWVLTEESFMKNLPIVNYLKYKISYGIVGEQGGIGYYPAYNTFDVSNLNGGISISPRDIGNPDLTWETTKMFQTGIEFGIKKYFEGSIDYYIKNTENLLFDRRVGPSVGYAMIKVNDGVLRNSGIEFDFTAHAINTTNYGLDFTINGELLSNKLITMPIDPATNEPKIIDISGAYGRAEGHSLFDFYLREWAGVDPANGTAMWYQNYYDANGNGALDTGEGIASLYDYTITNPNNAISVTTTKTYANATQKYNNKSAIPKVRGAFRLEGRVKNFDITAQFLYSIGGYAYDGAYAGLMNNGIIGNNNWSTDILNRWQKPGDITDVPRLSNNQDTNVASLSTRFLTRAGLLSLNNIRVGYTVPKQFTSKISISSANIFVSGDNLYLLSARNGLNTSTHEAGSSNIYRYSPLTTYTVGLKVKF